MKLLQRQCECFVKVYVCPACVAIAGCELSERVKGLRGQLDLGILDTMVSVSGKGEGERDVTNGSK